MRHEFDDYIGGIDFCWIEQAAKFTAEGDGCKFERTPEGDGLELLELLPPHRSMWVRRENKVFAEVIWVARVALRSRRFGEHSSHKRELLVLIAGDFCDGMFGLYAYSMHQLALSVPSDGSVESFDANSWDTGNLSRDKALHGNGFHHTSAKAEVG